MSDLLPDGYARPSGIFCNRTLNLRSIAAVGYDLDYTLVHYRTELWEERAYAHTLRGLSERGWPVDDLTFDPELAIQGLVIDSERGNVVKANRFGYIKRVYHGTQPLAFEEQRKTYRRTLVELDNPRWRFVDTLFSISETSLYLQLVDLLDEGKIPERIDYEDLYWIVRETQDVAHIEGVLKAEILKDPRHFVDVDPEVPLTLLDQKMAGKKLLLITNSEWEYAAPMLDFAFDPHLPDGMQWRDLFDLVIVGARKPAFFAEQAPAFEVVGEGKNRVPDLRPVNGGLEEGTAYWGGNAALVEETLGLRGDEILYVGDHVNTDVMVSKSVQRWRTALILRPLEEEITRAKNFSTDEARLSALMANKERLEAYYSDLRLEKQRLEKSYSSRRPAAAKSRRRRDEAGSVPETGGDPTSRDPAELGSILSELREQLLALDDQIAPLARAAAGLGNPHWGPLLRAGNDKSLFARQVETNADVYTSRVSNFLRYTPFVYLRSHRGTLPHEVADPGPRSGETMPEVEDVGEAPTR